MVKTYRYRLHPTAEPAAFLNRQFGSVRYVFNWVLAVATTTYQTQGEGITRWQLDKRLTVLQQALPWLQEVAAQPLQQALVHRDKAFTWFLREKKGHPRFQSKRDKPSVTHPQGSKNRVKLRRQIARLHERVIGRFAPSPADRQWNCPNCRRHHDREVLAANNIQHRTGRGHAQ